MQWDASGELLAILPRGNSFAIVWTASTRDIAQSEVGFKVQLDVFVLWFGSAGAMISISNIPTQN